MFWSIVNYEVWDIGRPMPRQVIPAPTGVPLLPDVPHWSWHEYGMRVGAWRFFELYEQLGIRPTLATNARTCEDYPRVAEEAKRLGWEFMGHAYDQMPIHKVEDQRGMINRSMDIIERFTGKRPVGWLGPGLTQTLDTPELLVEAGVKYIGDWVYDDEPTVIRTAKGPLVTLPYTVEINDITMMIVQHHPSDYLLGRAKDQFDRLWLEGAKRPKIMALAIHPYISGQPHRIKYLEAIYDYVKRLRRRAALERRGDLRLVPRHRRRQARPGRGVSMSTKLQLSISFAANPRTWPLIDGAVTVDGVDLVITPSHPSEIFWRQLKFADFDISEMSMSSLMMAMAHGDDRFVGMPIFTTPPLLPHRHAGAARRRHRDAGRPQGQARRRARVSADRGAVDARRPAARMGRRPRRTWNGGWSARPRTATAAPPASSRRRA